MGFSLLPREDEYFEYFSQMAGKIEEAAAILAQMLDGSIKDLGEFKQRIKEQGRRTTAAGSCGASSVSGRTARKGRVRGPSGRTCR